MTPLEVGCGDCSAPAGTPCIRQGDGPEHHATRVDAARLASVEHGTCTNCHAGAVRGQRAEAGPTVCWHPLPADAERCPPHPDPATDWNAYAEAVEAGYEPGVIHPDWFVVNPPQPVERTADLPGYVDPMRPPT